MGSSRARPVLLLDDEDLDDEDLDIVMEENGNGRLRELYNELCCPISPLCQQEKLAKFKISFCRFKGLADQHNREFHSSHKVERRRRGRQQSRNYIGTAP
jgi:hypothetical protein